MSTIFRRTKFSLFAFAAILFGTILVSVANSFAAESTKSGISLTVPGSCTVSGENHNYSKEMRDGTYGEVGGGTVFNIYCNDEEGYVVYAVGNGKDISSGDGVVKEGVTDLIGKDNSNIIHTGTNQSGNESNWSFKLSNTTSGMVIAEGFNDNAKIPSSRTKVVSRPSGTAVASGDTFTATYFAYITNLQKPDTYTGGVKYVMFHPSSTVFYEINYHLNSGEWSGKSPQTGTEAGGSVTLDKNIPTKSGYNFKGWCTVEVTNNDSSSPTCSGETYQAGNGVPLPEVDNKYDLYAIWETAIPAMQNWSGCSSLAKGSTTSLKDTRDGTVYTVAKLNDERCWMTQNLAIADKTIASADSDVSSNFKLPSSSTSGFNSPITPVANVYIDPTYGGYYTWYAATAGEGTKNKTSGDTSHSICPKGWKLPSKTEYDTLISKQGSANFTKSPANFMLGGYYSSDSAYDQGSYGSYWSSTAYDEWIAYILHVYSSGAQPSYGDYNTYRDIGDSVRCVARQ